MKRIILICASIFAVFECFASNEITQEVRGVKYKVISESTVSVVKNNNKLYSVGGYKFKNISIPEKVRIRNKEYTVTEIGEYAFAEEHYYSRSTNPHYLKRIILPKTITRISYGAFLYCKELVDVALPNSLEEIGEMAFFSCDSLKELVIPNTVKVIGSSAFHWCRNLKTIVVPDFSPQIIRENNKKDEKLFYACRKLKYIRGYKYSFPYWAKAELDYLVDLSKYQDSFDYYAFYRIIDLYNEWALKNEYETTDQWQQRTNQEVKNQKLQEIKEQVQMEYIKIHAPKSVKYAIGRYDADCEVFPITLNNMKPAYVKVPISEAQNFKDNFTSVVIEPIYSIIDDNIGVSAYTCILNGQEYTSPRIYDDENKNMALIFPPQDINIGEYSHSRPSTSPVSIVIDNSVDKDIPVASSTNKTTFAVIIGNENYQRVNKVQFALNDAKIFASYCQKTLGLPQKNVRVYNDATFATMLAAVDDIKDIAKAYNGELNVIFYYAGHGVPNESSGATYLLPVDTDGRNTEVCYPLERLYQELGGMNARSITVFMDACFSGSERGNNMLVSARGVAIKAKAAVPHGRMTVFSAASGDETAYPYKEKGHGLFTYFLLKKLQETKGNVTLCELGSYIIDNVSKESIVSNGKSQTPTVIPSQAVVNSWQSMKLK